MPSMDLLEFLRGLESVLAGAGGEADVGWDDMQLPDPVPDPVWLCCVTCKWPARDMT